MHGLAIHGKQRRTKLGRHRLKQVTADQLMTLKLHLHTGRFIGVRINEINDPTVGIAHGIEHHMGIQQRIHGGGQAGPFLLQNPALLHQGVHILKAADPPPRAFGRRRQGPGQPLHPVEAPLPGSQPQQQVDGPCFLIEREGVLGIHKVGDGGIDQFLHLPTQHGLDRRGDPGDSLLMIGFDHHRGGIFRQQAIATFTALESLLGLTNAAQIGNHQATNPHAFAFQPTHGGEHRQR